MNSPYFGYAILASGQSVPFTGAWVDISNARNAMLVVYGSGISGNVSAVIQAKTELFGDPAFSPGGVAEGVNINTFSPLINGYSTPAFLDTPVAQIRLVGVSGSGQIFAYSTIQN